MQSLYVHIPFCSHLCHYCDFVKTANYRVETVAAYFAKLGEDAKRLEQREWRTIFLGGGTPGLFAGEYRDLFAGWRADEFSIEANPLDCTPEKLKAWREIGINRLSMGVQTFDERGLKVLSRNHRPDEARRAIELALRFFDNVNVDLIYGWPGQESVSEDANILLKSGIHHISGYALSYEFGTTLYRRLQRKTVEALDDDRVADLYEALRDALRAGGFHQDEVSNWHRPGYACEHNKIYWQDGGYEGIGAGAHGYREDVDGIGERYRQNSDLRRYIEGVPAEREQRASIDWLREYVGCALRCEYGLDLSRIERKAHFKLVPGSQIEQALQREQIVIRGGQLRLHPAEWYRETAWAGILLDGFQPHA